MELFIVGLLCGALAGFLLAALCVMAGYEEHDR